jgi:chemotaxis protein methyltransferase CheR
MLEKVVVPHLLEHSNGRLRVWSAACSTGDEPYTLAMVLSEFLPLSQIEIIATDLDKEVLRKAKQGWYNEKSVKGLPKKYIAKFFEKTDNDIYQVSASLKRCITFKEHDLLKDTYPTNVDLVVCRNVLIYFTEEAKDNIYKNIAKSLKKDGVLFVGNTEQIIGSSQYGLESFKSFFYKKL